MHNSVKWALLPNFFKDHPGSSACSFMLHCGMNLTLRERSNDPTSAFGHEGSLPSSVYLSGVLSPHGEI